MKSSSKRGSAVLTAPEERYASGVEEAREAPWAASSAAVREPAPAGALHRAHASDYAPVEDDSDDVPYVSAQSQVRFRVRGMLRSKVGRIVLASMSLFLICSLTIAALAARNYLLHDSRFVVTSTAEIETVGITRLTRLQLLSVFGEDLGRNVFRIPLSQRRADAERLPWVQHATVMRLLPNKLRVSVVERTPVAFVRQGTHIGLVDGNGVLLDMPSNAAGDPHYSFPVLTGLLAEDPLPARRARVEIYRRFMQELESAGPKVTDTFSEVDVSNPEDVKALISSGETDIMVHFGDENFLERYRHFEEHLPEWKQQYPRLASADMRYDRQVVLDTGAPNGAPTKASPAAPAVEEHAAASPLPLKPAPVAARSMVEASPNAVAKHNPTVRPVSTAAGRTSASNAKMFAALAAASRQQKAAISGQEPR